jgi:gingipain R
MQTCRMKKLLLISALMGVSASYAQQFSLISGGSENAVISYTVTQTELKYRALDGESYIDFLKTHKVVSAEKGAPALPRFSTSVQLPASGSPLIVVEYDAITEIQNVGVLPSKGNLKRNVDPASVPFVFGEAYQRNAFYPASPVSLSDPFVWRTTRGATVSISPYQYNPVTRTLRIHENMRVRVEYRTAVPGASEIVSSQADPLVREAQQRFFINYQAPKYNAVGESGDLLVITAPGLQNSIHDLVEWKIAKGLSTEVVTTETAGQTDEEIKAFIQDYYAAHPSLLYILLVGDHQFVPAHSYGTSFDGEELWSDSYYGQLAGGDNDFLPEAFVGRFPAANATEALIMAKRTVEYERNPMSGTWMERAIGIGSSEGSGIGDDGEIDYEHLRTIREKLLDFGYQQVYEFYQGSQGEDDATGNPNSAMVADAINGGAGLINYTGHGSALSFVTSSYSYTTAMNGTNEGMYPFVVSVACNNGTFPNANCLGEGFLRSENQGNPAGGIAFAGSSILMSWAPPMQTQDEMTEILTEAYAGNKKATIGGLFYNAQLSMLEEYSDQTGTEVMQTWILFGDPSTVFINRQLQTMTVSHVSHLDPGASALAVSSNTEGAMVAVSQNGVLLGTAIVSGGQANVLFPGLTSEMPLTVVATKQNYRPYLGPVQVGNGPLGIAEAEIQVSLFPNPAADQVSLLTSKEISGVKIFSVSGQEVMPEITEITGGVKLDVSSLGAGSYLVHIATADGISVKRLGIVR